MASDVKSFRALIEEMKSAVANRVPAGEDAPRNLYESEAARADAQGMGRATSVARSEPVPLEATVGPRAMRMSAERMRRHATRVNKQSEGVVSVGTLASVARLISDENQFLLRLIAQGQVGSVAELAALTHRAESNLSRTLKKLEGMGLLQMLPGRGRAKVPQLTVRSFTVEVDVMSGRARVTSADVSTPNSGEELNFADKTFLAGALHGSPGARDTAPRKSASARGSRRIAGKAEPSKA
jgi:predicted transcriptional regulator